MVSVRHTFTSTKGLGADPTKVRSIDWNADHVVPVGTDADDLAAGNHRHGFDVRTYGAVGDGVADDTAEIQAALAATGVRGGEILLPPLLYKVSGTLSVGRAQRVLGGEWDGSRLQPTAGMAVPVLDLTGEPGGEGATISRLGIQDGGSAGVPAIRASSYAPLIERVRVESWDGYGVESLAPNGVHFVMRDTRLVNLIGDGVRLSATASRLDNCISSNGGGHGFWLRGGVGTLTGCSADVNAGNGFYITGGKWVLEGCYGEANTGNVIRVDGTQEWDTGVQLNGAASQGATTITVDALIKGLPERTLLRFPDGTWSYNQNQLGVGTTSITLIVPLATAQPDNAVVTITANDLNPAALPVVVVKSCYLDGSIYLNACHYSFEGSWIPVGGGGITAEPSARMIESGADVWTAKQRPRQWGGGGGSKALTTILGATKPMPPFALTFVEDPLAEYNLAGNGTRTADSSGLAGFVIRLDSQFRYAESSEGWKTTHLPIGQYTIRAHVRNTANEAGAVGLRTNFTGGSDGISKNVATVTSGFEWVEMDYDHTANRKANGGSVAVQRLGSTTIDVDAIVIVPKMAMVAATGHIKPGSSATAGRPSASSVGAGAMWYDTTLGKPIWSDGTVWRDATGTAV